MFPTVTELAEFRKCYTLSSPDVIALGTLGFGSVEEKDALAVVIAPSPESEEFATMLDIVSTVVRPVVIINCHPDAKSGKVSVRATRHGKTENLTLLLSSDSLLHFAAYDLPSRQTWI